MAEFNHDAAKAANNYDKYGVTFEEGQSVFNDSRALTIPDKTYSREEQAFKTIGLSDESKCLAVTYTYRNRKIHIHNVRVATANEKLSYIRKIFNLMFGQITSGKVNRRQLKLTLFEC